MVAKSTFWVALPVLALADSSYREVRSYLLSAIQEAP